MDQINSASAKNSPIVVGLDIGTTKICVTVGRRSEHGKIEVLGMGKAESAGVTRGVVSNIQKTVQAIILAVEEASAQSNVDVKIVNVGIAGQHIKSLQHRGILTRKELNTEIQRKDIDKLIEDMYKLVMPPGEEIIHVLPQEFTVDNEPGIKDPIGMAGVRLEANFHIISGHVSAVKNILKCVGNAGLETQELILEPLASSESVLSEEEKEAGVVLVDIGGGTTDLAIFHEGIIRHTAVIPFGGNSVTEDIREGCSVMRNQAELLKTRFGSALAEENKENEIICVPGLRGREPKEISVKNLAYVIQARMEEIIEHVYYEIKSSGYEKKLIAGIVITGGGAQLKHLPQLVEFVTGLDSRIGYPNEHLAKNDVLPKNVYDELKSPMYATGIGLLIKGIQKAELVEESVVSIGAPVEKTKAIQKPKKGQGMFEWILQSSTKFIKDDIKDEDYTN
ncbi:MAG: cell division protein FtsA [Sphingobacteriales bacterium 17-39-43]|uniref:cell division protein FtsA n=1 Tax=Daejeonella sp. TaxID=2805397 RepID=UPI000BDA31DD|nr:cell division protein FtsA [Daejeonella sp.]OYY04310.1 MAG: cell division protein FtsA [Sphingobacteriia bacterium 35-40-5]OYZ29081.1 MAG: cell division protein FtsA [Sphingobacteriales bacterium 16-39-50]OZA23094.1 MAG: cell division protein FtsA [Sphingobacteriales bacterium 17-39-43]OZA62264.1 MAG: cell division protein FtsA [Sphingobacteriales bacterium 39-40-5]HQS50330.1 cell division protein FtsA [Daejeonella sp.]